MAYQISNGTTVPHATNESTLLDALVTFVTANGWTLERDNRLTLGNVILKGSGTSGTDAIYVGIQRYYSPGNDTFGWYFQGYTAVTGAGFNIEPGAITGRVPCLPLWNDTIRYWFFCNARRIVVVALVGTVYVSAYLGYILPYASPGQWPYPLVIGGSNVTDNFYNVPRYSDTSANMDSPFTCNGGTDTASQLVVRDASGAWVRLFNRRGGITPPGQTNNSLWTARGVWPYVERYAGTFGWWFVRPNMAGDESLLPLRLVRDDTPDMYGIFDGVRFISGVDKASEHTKTENGNTWIAFQNTFRNTLQDFFAVLRA